MTTNGERRSHRLTTAGRNSVSANTSTKRQDGAHTVRERRPYRRTRRQDRATSTLGIVQRLNGFCYDELGEIRDKDTLRAYIGQRESVLSAMP